ncbi:peroxisomal targeting signal 1 receptor-like, partial [Manduca sexta]|uniref:peroxisomal targeting signal 1 receptor-like n=1 Tax=Manduca sexta TaxID=7130 RepID=UPI00188E0FA8
MSLNKLVGGDCGGNNALVQLSKIVSRDAAISQQHSQADRFVNEFMTQNPQTSQTFNMNALLGNLPKTENKNTALVPQTTQVPGISSQVSRQWGAGPSTSYIPSQPILRPFFMPQQSLLAPQTSSNIQLKYISESEVATNTDVKAKAQEYVNAIKDDDELAYNQFMSFMKRISAGELNLGETTEGTQKKLSKDEFLTEMEEKYKEDWDRLSNITDYWSSETANGIPKEYTFSEGNIMLENKSALEIGKEKLKMGDIPGASLCFEAACQQQPDSAEAWFLLGTTQAENEQDPLAITALKNWLRASPKYNDLMPQDVDPKKMDLKELENHVKSLYMKAVQLQPTQIDPDVQNALGVVFNISQEYDKAVDCFKTALMVAADNAKLWNRLGATLANSDRSEEAVDAYHEALNLEPGFIRARYNVGITCMNLGAH